MGTIFFEVLYRPLYNLLVVMHDIFPWGGLGLAIILTTVGIKVLLLPLTYRTLKAQKEMQEMQPRIQAIREEFKDDQEKMAKELMGVYKKHNVNPFAACLPTILQLFIFIALYRALAAGIHEINPAILYEFVKNPGMMSPIFLGIDLAKVSIPLGLAAGAFQYIQARQMIHSRPPKPARGQSASLDEDMTATMNQMTVTVLPIMMAVVGSTTLPGGLTLYILTSTILTYVMNLYFLPKPKDVHSEAAIEAKS